MYASELLAEVARHLTSAAELLDRACRDLSPEIAAPMRLAAGDVYALRRRVENAARITGATDG